ncbi:cyclase family protein [Rhodococcus rhodochrous]|uniref:Cyclase family protein n=1 Tax=Rhodococcus rhodochrous TaxID=1829 RepID=A0AA46X593_RHORH|nr:cyclase family protein [Rhodococcus rhodochrous]MCB8913954.1 cyclase family protein [Rhodococcus rhodochrous]UZF48331.1 cyclase family protein [Rhodococcus rhodochrous]
MHGSETQLFRRAHDRASVEKLALRYRTWDRWGIGDQLGAGNRITPERIAAAARNVRRGAVFSLALALDRTGPMRGGGPRVNPQHVMLRTPHDPIPGRDDNGLQRAADDAVYMPLQCSTQWDAFCHIFYDGVTYGGRGFDSVTTLDGAGYNSITTLGDRGLGRGVLLDMARHRGKDYLVPGEAIQAEDLAACAERQQVDVREGDIVLVRTGHLEYRRQAGNWGDYAGGPAPGLGVGAAEFLCERGVAAVASDTWGLEAMPFETPDLMSPLHIVLLVNAGIYIGEMWDVAELAADCAADGVYEFFLVAQPLMVTGSTGSPLNPLAIK